MEEVNDWVPVRVAAEQTYRSPRTLRTWARNGSIRSHRDAETGRLFVSLLDTLDRSYSTPRRRRVA